MGSSCSSPTTASPRHVADNECDPNEQSVVAPTATAPCTEADDENDVTSIQEPPLLGVEGGSTNSAPSMIHTNDGSMLLSEPLSPDASSGQQHEAHATFPMVNWMRANPSGETKIQVSPFTPPAQFGNHSNFGAIRDSSSTGEDNSAQGSSGRSNNTIPVLKDDLLRLPDLTSPPGPDRPMSWSDIASIHSGSSGLRPRENSETESYSGPSTQPSVDGRLDVSWAQSQPRQRGSSNATTLSQCSNNTLSSAKLTVSENSSKRPSFGDGSSYIGTVGDIPDNVPSNVDQEH